MTRPILEIVIDSCYLVLKDDVSLWKRYFAYGDLDRIKLKVRAIQIHLKHKQYNVVDEEIILIKEMLEKCFVDINVDHERKISDRIFESILSKDKLDQLIGTFQELDEIGKADITVLDIEKLKKINNTLRGVSNWRGKGIEKAFAEICHTLQKQLKKENLSIFLDEESFIMYDIGNASIHSSDTLLYWSYDKESETFDSNLDKSNDNLYGCLFLPLQLMGWALYRLQLTKKEVVMQLLTF